MFWIKKFYYNCYFTLCLFFLSHTKDESGYAGPRQNFQTPGLKYDLGTPWYINKNDWTSKYIIEQWLDSNNKSVFEYSKPFSNEYSNMNLIFEYQVKRTNIRIWSNHYHWINCVAFLLFYISVIHYHRNLALLDIICLHEKYFAVGSLLQYTLF